MEVIHKMDTLGNLAVAQSKLYIVSHFLIIAPLATSCVYMYKRCTSINPKKYFFFLGEGPPENAATQITLETLFL